MDYKQYTQPSESFIFITQSNTMNTTSISRLFAIATLAAVMACSPSKKETPETPAEDHDHAAASVDTATAGKPQYTVAPAFQQQLAGVFTAYLQLKESFVASDAARVQSASQGVQMALESVDMTLVDGAAHHDWMTHQQGMSTTLKAMQTSPANLDDQRKAFSSLSQSLYQAIKAYGLGSSTAYYEFCPMAFNNEGAFWLSDSKTIRNPYFGDKMLTCGEVRETL
jgi:Cu(I)/Ag(I) efflux system membrane fusion protein